jgi:DNA-binding response OmpR family regulator
MTATASAVPDLQPKGIVVVADQNDDTRLLYADAFRRDGWRVVEAIDGRDALVKALTSGASLVVTDLRLPFIDGLALCEVLRRDQATRAVPIVVITAEARHADLMRIARCGATAVLTKPAAFDEVLGEGRRLLEEAQREGGNARPTAVAHPDGRRRRPVDAAAATPARETPRLLCPMCSRPLTLESRRIGGVGRIEQWDVLVCNGGGCGEFEYRHRTGKLRPVVD